MNEPRRPASPASDDAAIVKAAADWITRLDRGLTPAEAAEFAAWEAADPRHAAELTQLNATWRLLDTADEVPEIMRLAQEMEARQERWAAVRRRGGWALAGAAAAALVALSWVAIGSRPGTMPPGGADAVAAAERSYQIVPSTARRLALADGSQVELRGDSVVETAFSTEERRVRIVRGEAYFRVEKDAARAFVVQAGEVAVRAVGTEFNVQLGPATVEVLVTEGRVRVDDAAGGRSLLAVASSAEAGPPLLGAGQRVVLAATEPVAVAPRDASAGEFDRGLAWRSAQLVFDGTPLGEAVAVFNSFNRRQLVLGDPALRGRRLGGTFRAENLDTFVRLLETGFDLVAEPRGDHEIVLQPAATRRQPE